MSLALCDPGTFYPLRNLVAGPLTDLRSLAEVERFVRAVVLHDEISMVIEPWPYDPDSDREFTEEEQHAGGRNVILAVAPALNGYGFFNPEYASYWPDAPDVPLSSALIQTARECSNAEQGNVYFEAHIRYSQCVVATLQAGGSTLLAGPFGNRAIKVSSAYPEALFANLDRGWQQIAQETDSGEIGVAMPPVRSIILTRCARPEAIPAIIEDLRY